VEKFYLNLLWQTQKGGQNLPAVEQRISRHADIVRNVETHAEDIKTETQTKNFKTHIHSYGTSIHPDRDGRFPDTET
jgi:hypothetical protein